MKHRWIARAVDLVVLGAVVPFVLLPVAVVGGTVLFAAVSGGDCPSPCEGPGQLGMLLWGVAVLIGWFNYRPGLRRLGRRTAGRWAADSLVRRADR